MPGNNPKKSNDKRESVYKQQRKNSSGAGAVKKDISSHSNSSLSSTPTPAPVTNNTNANMTMHKLTPKAQQAAGAAILLAVNSPQPSSAEPPTAATGLNGFNRGEVSAFLNMRFSDALTASHDTNLDPSVRPEKYESKSMPTAATPAQQSPATTTTFAWGKQHHHPTHTLPWAQPEQQQSSQPKEEPRMGAMANGVDFLAELSKRLK